MRGMNWKFVNYDVTFLDMKKEYYLQENPINFSKMVIA